MDTHIAQTDALNNVSMPPGIIIPVLVYADVATAVDWLCSTFGFNERLRIGDHRSQLVFRETSTSVVVTASNGRDMANATDNDQFKTHSLMVCIPDVDRHFAHVKKCEAHILHPPQTYPFGERQYTVEDIGGHRWTFTQSVANVAPDEWGGQLLIP